MALILEIRDAIGVVIPSGSLDAPVVDSFRREVHDWWEAHPELKRIAVDLGGVDFVDSSGLGALIGMVKRAAARGGNVKLARPKPSVKLVLEITRANRIFGICATLEDALAPTPAAEA